MMNERIKELKNQCWVEKHWDKENERWIDRHVDLEKFAELIVRECCSVADEVERADTGMFVSWYLKAHFGVEE